MRFNPPARQISGETGQSIPDVNPCNWDSLGRKENYTIASPLPLEKSRGSVGRQDRTLMTQESSLDDPAPEPESPSAGILSEAEICRELVCPCFKLMITSPISEHTHHAHLLLIVCAAVFGIDKRRPCRYFFWLVLVSHMDHGSTIRHQALLWHMAR